MSNVLRALDQRGLRPVIVVGSGNLGLDAKWSGFPYAADPAVTPEANLRARIIVVAGSDMQDERWRDSVRVESNFGSLVDLFAPSKNVATIGRFDQPVQSTGTSFAAPLVTGAIGLLKSFNPGIPNDSLKSLLAQSAEINIVDHGRSIPLLDVYGALRAAARRPGGPLCGNPVTFTAQIDTIQQTSTITMYTKRIPGVGGFEALSTFTVPGVGGAPVYLPHGGKQILVDLGDGLGLHRVAQYTASGWQTLSAPWPIATDSSVSGVTWSSRGWSHNGDTALYVIKTMNPGFVTANVSFNLWSNGILGPALVTRSNLADRWTPSGGGGPNGGGVGFAGTLSPTGRFAITVVTDGATPGQYRFSKVDLPSGSDSLLFTDVFDLTPQYPSSYAGPAPFFGLTIAEDGSELWYTAPVQNEPYYFGCVLKRYSLTQRQFASVDVLPGNGLTACTPTSFAWQGGAARVVGPRVTRR